MTTPRWEEKCVLGWKCTRSTDLFVVGRLAGRALGIISTATGEELVSDFMIEDRFILRLPIQRKSFERQPLINRVICFHYAKCNEANGGEGLILVIESTELDNNIVYAYFPSCLTACKSRERPNHRFDQMRVGKSWLMLRHVRHFPVMSFSKDFLLA